MKSFISHTKEFDFKGLNIVIEYGYDVEMILSPVVAITQSLKNRKVGLMVGLIIFNTSITIEY